MKTKMMPPEAVATWAANSKGENEKSFIIMHEEARHSPFPGCGEEHASAFVSAFQKGCNLLRNFDRSFLYFHFHYQKSKYLWCLKND